MSSGELSHSLVGLQDSLAVTTQNDDPKDIRDTEAHRMATSIVKLADRFVRNGQLTLAELSTYLPGTEHEGFLEWFTDAKHRRVIDTHNS